MMGYLSRFCTQLKLIPTYISGCEREGVRSFLRLVHNLRASGRMLLREILKLCVVKIANSCILVSSVRVNELFLTIKLDVTSVALSPY